jgi:hypothetical protein
VGKGWDAAPLMRCEGVAATGFASRGEPVSKTDVAVARFGLIDEWH